MKIHENAELVEVSYENNDKKAVMLFTGEDGIMDVRLNIQNYDEATKKWVDDPAKEEKVNETTQAVFGCDFKDIVNCVGGHYTVYAFDKKDGTLGYSLTKGSDFAKFDEDMFGMIYQTKVDAVVVDENGIHVQYKIDDKIYRTNHSFTQYIQRLGKSFPDENKRRKSLKTFQERYGVPVEEADSIIGHDLMVEVKRVGSNGAFYGETKAFPKQKSKK